MEDITGKDGLVQKMIKDAVEHILGKIIYKMIDTKYDTTYNIDRRYSECQSGVNY